MRFFCCCQPGTPTGTECQPCPTPYDPALPVRHKVTVSPFTIWGDSTGSGALYGVSDMLRACMAGGCTRQKYRRKALYVSDFSPPCAEYEEWCDQMVDIDGPEFYSDGLTGEFTGCLFANSVDAATLDGSTEFTSIGQIRTCVKYQCVAGFPVLTDAQAGPGPVLTTVEVGYSWPGDTFTLPGLMSDCSVSTITAAVGGQGYACLYGREVALGERYALGAYRLLAVSWSEAAETVRFTGTAPNQTLTRCCLGTECEPYAACRPSYDSAFPGVPYSWTVPDLIYVSRIN